MSRLDRSASRRVLALVICYALALQALLAAYGTSFAVGRTDGGTVICHGDGTAPSGGGNVPSENPPCALCALAAAASGLLPDPATVLAAPLAVSTRLALADTIRVLGPPATRAGLARAPPVLA